MTTKRSGQKQSKFAPAAWQWDPSSVTSTTMQWWSAAGSMSIITTAEARRLIAARAAFAGSDHHVCQVHDRIDGASAGC